MAGSRNRLSLGRRIQRERRQYQDEQDTKHWLSPLRVRLTHRPHRTYALLKTANIAGVELLRSVRTGRDEVLDRLPGAVPLLLPHR